MKPIRKILVPTDFSEAADGAIDEAVGLARTLGASITLLHVCQPPPTLLEASVVFGPDVIDALHATARGPLERARTAVRQRTPDCPPIDIKTVLGNPDEQIMAEAARGYDLVVMSTHGRTGLKHLLIGSVAERVVRSCSAPVLTVRAAPQTAAVASASV